MLINGEQLPKDIFQKEYEIGDKQGGGFYTICETGLTAQEKNEYMMFMQLEYLKSVKKRMTFLLF